MGKFADAQERVTSWSETIDDEPELTNEHLARLDEIYNAAHEFCRVIMDDPDMEYDQFYAGQLTDFAVGLLLKKGKPIYYPCIVECEDGVERVEEFCEPDLPADKPTSK